MPVFEIRRELNPIGIINSPYKTEEEAPPQGTDTISEIKIFEEYAEGLQDIEGFSHLHVIYWLHKSKDWSLSVRTPWNSKPHGLFATRSPNRPNPFGYSVVELVGREGLTLKVRGLDAINGTPVLDIKPYIRAIDSKPNAKSGWLENKYRLIL